MQAFGGLFERIECVKGRNGFTRRCLQSKRKHRLSFSPQKGSGILPLCKLFAIYGMRKEILSMNEMPLSAFESNLRKLKIR